jgi:tripartite-type tricarboxylate transporter receptor subunit TctC
MIFFLGLVIIVWSPCMAQETFPSRPITIVLGSAPGGSLDLSGRIVAGQLENELGVSVIVLAKPGGGQVVAAEFVRQLKPDGHTLIEISSQFVGTTVLDPKCPVTMDDFDPIGLTATQSNVVVVGSKSPFKTINEVIDFAKKNPGKLSYGTAGIGSTGHFFGELLKQSISLDLTHVPFKGDGGVVAATVGGHVDLGFPTIPGASALIKGGVLRALVVSEERNSDFPEIPTITESGYPQASYTSWIAFLAPKGIPKPVMEKLSTAFERAINHPSVRKRLSQVGLTPAYKNPKELTEFMKKETEKLKKVAQKAGMVVKY